MPYTLTYFEEALLDVREAKQWYKTQRDGLEKEFSKSIKNALTKILNAPELNSICYKQVRFQHVERFPYVVHYYIDDKLNSIIVIAIIHKARHPDVTQKRL